MTPRDEILKALSDHEALSDEGLLHHTTLIPTELYNTLDVMERAEVISYGTDRMWRKV